MNLCCLNTTHNFKTIPSVPFLDFKNKSVPIKIARREEFSSSISCQAVEEGKESRNLYTQDDDSISKKNTNVIDSTDFVATFLTRRFGLKAGLAWLGVLVVGTVGEQVKTRLEVMDQEKNSKELKNGNIVKLTSGLSYIDKKLGGGISPINGYLTLINLRKVVDGEVVIDTFSGNKPIVFIYGLKPNEYLSPEVMNSLSTMKVGGIRNIMEPIKTEGNTEYEIELLKVSIAP